MSKVHVVRRSGVVWCAVLLLTLLSGQSVGAQPQPQPAYAPVLNEIMPAPERGEAPWIELRNPLDRGVPATLTLVVSGTFEYAIPERLPPVPPSAFIVIRLDGRGERANTYRYQGGAAELHSGQIDRGLLGVKPGYIEVYETGGGARQLVGFVAWGAPAPKRSLTVERARIWGPDAFVNMQANFGIHDPKRTILPGHSIGIHPSRSTQTRADWVTYAEDEVSLGKENAVPYPKAYTLGDGAAMRSEDIVVGWTGSPYARQYEVQLAKDARFDAVIDRREVNVPLYRPPTPLPEGVYYYRVRVTDTDGRQSRWSPARQVESKQMQLGGIGAVVEKKVVLPGDYRRQRKDTELLCLDGCASEFGAPPDQPWDDPHPDDVPIYGHDHGDMNCVRACMSMWASHFGKQLSQDRIAYYDREVYPSAGGAPEYDLAHHVGYAASDVEPVAEWVVGGATVDWGSVTDPPFSDLRAWLDADRVIMTATCGHMRVMSAYRVDDAGDEWVQIMDPWTGLDPVSGEGQWQTYATWAGDNCYSPWVGPSTAPSTREDEDSIDDDSDADGIRDFDEEVRFVTGPHDSDSDNDRVDDKNDIREYVFDAADDYDKRTADFDADGKRKERDPDNDADGFADGCEDPNANGKHDTGEPGDNFDDTTTGLTCPDKPTHCVIVFDRSGSMSSPSADPKYDNAADAAELFLNTWLVNAPLPDTQVGLVFYDHNAYFDTDTGTNTTLDDLAEAKVNEIVAAFADNEPMYGSTSIGGGLLEAMEPDGFDVENVSADDQNRVVVVLTDGKENTAPNMDDPAVVAKLVDGQVAGYVLGIGDEPYIDADKLNQLATILGNYPASFAKDLDADELQKFFLHVLEETRGLDVTVDPSGVIMVGRQKDVHVPVNPGARRATFVVMWDDPSVTIDFGLRDPNGSPVTPDATRSGARHRVAAKEKPMAGIWTLELTASGAGAAGRPIGYRVTVLEDNDHIVSAFQARGGLCEVGDPILLVADLFQDGKPITKAKVVAEVARPKVRLDDFLRRPPIPAPTRMDSPEKGIDLTPRDSLALALEAKRIRMPTSRTAVQLNDWGVDGDVIPGDGRYTGYFRDTGTAGVYKFRIIARGGDRRAPVSRERTITVLMQPQAAK